MSSLHKFKAYFGMVPLDDYEDEYLDEPDQVRRGVRGPRDPYLDREDREFVEPAFGKAGYPPSRRSELDEEFDRYDTPRHATRVDAPVARSTRPTSATSMRSAIRGSLAVEPRSERADGRRGPLFDEGGPLSKITTLRPRDYSEARTIGERFRDGTPVIMDLVEMSNADAKRLVDFAGEGGGDDAAVARILRQGGHQSVSAVASRYRCVSGGASTDRRNWFLQSKVILPRSSRAASAIDRDQLQTVGFNGMSVTSRVFILIARPMSGRVRV